MTANRFERGAVVRCNNRTWIVWAYPSGLRFADPLALPVMPQTGPRHRAQVRLTFASKPVMINLLDRISLPHLECQQIGQCTEEIVALLGASMQRAIDAEQTERRLA